MRLIPFLVAPAHVSTTALAAPPAFETKLLPSHAGLYYGFGEAVDVDGGTALVGAPSEDAPDDQSGAAYLFDLATGQEYARLVPPTPAEGMHFGSSVALTSTAAIVGTDNGNAARIWVFDRTTGAFITEIPGTAEHYGQVLAADPDTDTVLVYALDYTPRPDVPHVDVIDLGDPAHPEVVRALTTTNTYAQRFGESLAISGNLAVVGTPGDKAYGTLKGAIYVFDVTTGQELAKILPPDRYRTNQFGVSVDIDDALIVVGARPIDFPRAYAFEAHTGRLVARLRPANGLATNAYGWSIAVAGGAAFVGDIDIFQQPGYRTGAAFRFDLTRAEPTEEVFAPDLAANHGFGNAVATDGDTLVIGAPGDYQLGQNAGAAYVFTVDKVHDQPCTASDWAPPFGVLTFDDISAYASAFLAGSTDADFDGSLRLNLDDLAAFVQDYLAGCP